MFESGISRESLIWAVSLGIIVPVLIAALGEMVMRLRAQGRAVASPLSAVRSLVLPTLATLLVLINVAGYPEDNNAVRIVQTLLSWFVIHTVLSFLNVLLFSGTKEGSWQSNVPQLFVDLARTLIVLISSAVVLSTVWKLDLGQVVAALGVGSIVVGLALQDPVGNLFSGIVLMFERPIKVGDYVKIENEYGEVCETNWRSVHVNVMGKGVLVVPNGLLAKASFSNLSRPVKVYYETVTLAFSRDDSPNKVKRILLETALRTPNIVRDPAPEVSLHCFSGFAVDYEVTLAVTDDWNRLRFAVDEFMTLVWYAARREGLTMPIPSSLAINATKQEVDAEAHSPIPSKDLEIFPRFQLTNGATQGKGMPKSAIRSFAKGEDVLVEGERLPGIYLILSGTVQLAARDNLGKEAEIAKLSRGEFFGEKAMLGEASDYTAKALDDLDLLLLDSQSLEEMLDRAPQLSREIGSVMETRRRALQAIRGSRVAAV